MGPRTTSPMAQMLGTVLRQLSSTGMKPRSSTDRPTDSRPRPSVLGTRPIETIRRSDSMLCSLPLASWYWTVTLPPLPPLPGATLTLPIFTPNSNFRPCFLKSFSASLLTAASQAPRKDGAISSTVTSAPRRRQTEPSSRPITPAPMTVSFFGTLSKARAPSLSHTSTLSTGTLGR